MSDVLSSSPSSLSALSKSPIRQALANKNMAKKAGAGGKGTWGVPGDELRYLNNINQADPNYDPDEEPFTLDAIQPKLTGPQLKEVIHDALKAFVEGTASVQETSSRLKQYQASSLYNFYIVSKLVKLGLPSHTDEVSFFLKYSCSEAVDLISREQLSRGIQDAFLELEEWELDAPTVREQLVRLVRSLEDHDMLPASFLGDQMYILEHHQSLKRAVYDAMEEFFVEFDIDEFVRTIARMNCPAFHGQVVKYVLRSALEKPPEKIEMAAKLLASLSGPKKPVSMLEFMQGVDLLLRECEDLAIDNPKCKKVLSELLARTVVDECVPPSYLDHVFGLAPDDLGSEVVNLATELLQQSGAAQRLHSMWQQESDTL
jgi:hypothetical protein